MKLSKFIEFISIYKPEIQLKTPEIKLKSFNKNDLTKNKFDHFDKRKEIMIHIYNSKNLSINEIKDFDYGDILEFTLS